jgi:hypothetical protein
MTEAWFDGPAAGVLGGLLGGVVGTVGGLFGGLMGFLAPRGRAKAFLTAAHTGFLAAGVVLLTTGVVAAADGQPFHVWYVFALSGAVMTAVFGGLWPVTQLRYRQAEERKMVAANLA